jgi:hypothetical protein
MVAPADALILPEGPMINKRPVSPQYSASASSSSSSYPSDYENPISSSASSSSLLTRAELERMPASKKDEKPGTISLRTYAKEKGIKIPGYIRIGDGFRTPRKEDIINIILESQRSM